MKRESLFISILPAAIAVLVSVILLFNWTIVDVFFSPGDSSFFYLFFGFLGLLGVIVIVLVVIGIVHYMRYN